MMEFPCLPWAQLYFFFPSRSFRITISPASLPTLSLEINLSHLNTVTMKCFPSGSLLSHFFFCLFLSSWIPESSCPSATKTKMCFGPRSVQVDYFGNLKIGTMIRELGKVHREIIIWAGPWKKQNFCMWNYGGKGVRHFWQRKYLWKSCRQRNTEHFGSMNNRLICEGVEYKLQLER